jgi:alginate O-acetyltransferase complex protein AlgI
MLIGFHMLFNSYPFLLLYLPAVLVIFFGLSKLRLIKAAKCWLLISSLFFYGYWDIRYLPLLLGSILCNYGCGSYLLKANESRKKHIYLALGIAGNLSLLFYFKYYHFFISHLIGDVQIADIILPLGISFFTFTQIAYLVDAYHKKAESCDFISYGLFVTIFPHLIAGPILHHREMLKQFNSLRMYILSWTHISQGIFLFTIGLFKKVIIADRLSVLAKPIFDQAKESIPFIQAWFGALTYTLQLYFDFSGYSDMAVGLGLLFSLRLPINFNSPYQADSMIDFWRRWHITLSQFLRDYLYISLGGNRNGKWAKLRNLFITMLLGGLWHGAGWTFILWGACHGLFLIINHMWRDFNISLSNWISKGLTLGAVISAWVIFRSPTIEQAINILSGMIGLHGVILPKSYASYFPFLSQIGIQFTNLAESKFRLADLALIFILGLGVLTLPNTNHWIHRFKKRPLAWGVACSLLFFISFLNLDEMSEFLYYQF